jgi:phage gpG-like protein
MSKIEVLYYYNKNVFDDIHKAVISAVEIAMAKTLELAVTEAKKLVRVDTGRLRSSFTYNYTGSGKTAVQPFKKTDAEGKSETVIKEPKEMNAIIGLLGTNVTYASYQEYGTKYMTGKPALHPALNYAGNIIESKIKQEIAKIKKV